MNEAAALGPGRIKWWQDWRGECAAIIGCGPSAKDAGVDLLRDRIHVIAVNESYQLAPWAELVYSCDFAWWQLKKGLPEFPGMKVTYDRRAEREYPGLHRLEIEQPGCDELLLAKPLHIGAGGNSGFQAMNLALQFGATGIMLIGIDCTLDKGEHWHGRHPYHMNNPAESNVKRWRRAFDGAAPRAHALGIDIVNCSPISALAAYPKMTVPEALARWGL